MSQMSIQASSLTADTPKRKESEQGSSAENENLLAGCIAANNKLLCDTPSVDLSRDRTALSGQYPEDELKAGRELELRNMLNFDAFKLVEELLAYAMVWVDEWRGDKVRSRLCARLSRPRKSEMKSGHQTARTFKIEVWTDSSSAKAIIQRLGPGRREKHLEVQTMWVQQLARIGLISLNKLNTLENVADLLTKHVPRAVLDKLAGMMGHSFPDEETAKFQAYENIDQNFWSQKSATVEKLPVFDDGDNEELENDVRSFVDKTTHLTTAVLRRGVEMNILSQPHLHRPHRDLLSHVTILGGCWDDTHKSRSVIKFVCRSVLMRLSLHGC